MKVSRKDACVTIEVNGFERTATAVREGQGRYVIAFGGHGVKPGERRWTDKPLEEAAVIAWRESNSYAPTDDVNEVEVAEIAKALGEAVESLKSERIFNMPDSAIASGEDRVEEFKEELVGIGLVRVKGGSLQSESVTYSADCAEIHNDERAAKIVPVLPTPNSFGRWQAHLDNGIIVESSDLYIVTGRAYTHVIGTPRVTPDGSGFTAGAWCNQSFMALRYAAECSAVMMREVRDLEENDLA